MSAGTAVQTSRGRNLLCPGHWQHLISCYFLLLVAQSSAKVPLPKLDALRVIQGQQTSSRLARRGQMRVVLAEQAASGTVLGNSSSDWQGCMLSRRAPMAAGLPREMRGQMTPFCWKPPWSACRACRGCQSTSLLWRPLWLSCDACSASWPRHMTTGQPHVLLQCPSCRWIATAHIVLLGCRLASLPERASIEKNGCRSGTCCIVLPHVHVSAVTQRLAGWPPRSSFWAGCPRQPQG